MLDHNLNEKVFLASGSTDMRKSINSLAVIVQEVFSLNPCSSSLFVFCSKNRTMLKILKWEHNGFWLYVRRLEKGKFLWPIDKNVTTLTITRRELNWLLDGLSIIQEKAHKGVFVEKVI